VESIDKYTAAQMSVVVIAPTVTEIEDIAEDLAGRYGDRVVQATSSMSDAVVTKSWSRLVAGQGTILIGTREVMFWPFEDVGIVVVVEDGRRVMRSPGTPTLSVRDVMMRRSASEGFPLVFHGPMPTLEILARSALIEAPAQRHWPMVEIVDRTEEPPGGGLLTERVKLAIKAAVDSGDRVFVLVGSRGYAPAFRCAKCGEIRRCSACGSAASKDQACRRCENTLGACAACGGGQFHPLGAGIGKIIDDISGVVPNTQVGRSEDHTLVTVGTERDLIGVHGVGLAVAVDIDGLTMAPHYRAAEDGLRLAIRLAQTVKKGAGCRCMIQTAYVSQPAIDALVDGRSEGFLISELKIRERFGFPPIGSLVAIETDGSYDVGALLTDQVSQHATVMGPAPVGDRVRWLVQARDLEPARLALRSILGTLRSKGAKVRVDVDPIDL
jgi:primosomal protein N'